MPPDEAWRTPLGKGFHLSALEGESVGNWSGEPLGGAPAASILSSSERFFVKWLRLVCLFARVPRSNSGRGFKEGEIKPRPEGSVFITLSINLVAIDRL